MRMSEYLDAEVHVNDDTVELRWLFDENKYALVMGHEMFDQLEVTQGQESPVLIELLVFDPKDGDNDGSE